MDSIQPIQELHRREVKLAAEAYRKARQRRDLRIREAVHSGGLTRKEVALLVGLSRSRIDQIAHNE